jgi:hypothetical protein
MATGRNHQRLSNALLVLVFLAAICVPLLATMGGVEGGDEIEENRDLAAFPRVTRTWASVAAFPSGFDLWFTDHFAFRKYLVQWFGESRYFWLGVSPSPSVVLGKDGFLFFGIDESIDDYANVRPFTEREIANWRDAIVRLRDWCERRGMAYVFTIAPDKYLVYPEEFPESVHRIGPTSRSDELYSALSDTRVVADIRPVLSHAKAQERLYYLTDTHWNDRGAFAAYQTIINAVHAQNPRVPAAWPRSDFEPVSKEIEGQDLAGMMGLTYVLHEDALTLVPKRPRLARIIEPIGANPRESIGRLITEIPGSTLPRAVVFRDSFTNGLVPYLSEHFSRVVYLWQNDVDADVIESEHPDVVIQEIVGRHLYSFVPTPSLIPSEPARGADGTP